VGIGKHKRKLVPKKWITLAELQLKNEADPAWVARQEAGERMTAEIRAKLDADEASLVAALANAGFCVRSVWDLVNSPGPYKEAIPVLLEHLKMPYLDRTRDGIARALAIPDARNAWAELVELFRKEPTLNENGKSETKSGLAAALAATAKDGTIQELIALAKDKTHGSSRVLLLRALRRSKLPSAKQAIEELAGDPDLAKEIASWRRRKVRLRTSNAAGDQ
jgi:hypothetical protein